MVKLPLRNSVGEFVKHQRLGTVSKLDLGTRFGQEGSRKDSTVYEATLSNGI
jgi:hypothetical protein